MSSRFFVDWRGRVFALVLVVLAASGSIALAADDDEYARSGPYVAARLGISTPTALADTLQGLVDVGISEDSRVRTDASIGVDGTVGYRFHPHFATEAQVQWIQGFSGTIANDEEISEGYTLTAGVNVKGYILTGRFQPYLLVGGAFVQNSTKYDSRLPPAGVSEGFITTQGGAFRAGGGFESYVTPAWAFTLGVDYVLTLGELEDLRYINVVVGTMYRF